MERSIGVLAVPEGCIGLLIRPVLVDFIEGEIFTSLRKGSPIGSIFFFFADLLRIMSLFSRLQLPLGLLLLLLGVASATAQESPLYRPVPPEESGITFSNYIVESDTFYMSVFIYAYNGAGVAVGDVNGDELPDIYFLGTQAHSPSRLYINQGGLKFKDASIESGLFDSVGIRFGVTMVDIDGDQDLDIYVVRQNDENSLYINDGSGHFVDKASEFGIDYCCSSMHATFLDYDRDGDLDLYLAINGLAFERRPMVKGLPDQFFRNDRGTFVNVTEETGIWDVGYAQSVTTGDVNNDGWVDIYVTNDFQEKDRLYLNNQDGTFTDQMKERMRHTSGASMGSEIADVNNDGHLDIVSLDMMPDGHYRKMANISSLSTFSPVFDSTQAVRNTLQINRGYGWFSDVAQIAGISATDWSWTALLIDADHDRDRDLFVTNGFKRDVQNLDVIQYFDPNTTKLGLMKRIPPVRVPNYFYRNDGGLRFSRVSQEWGVGQIINSNGSAYSDLDLDGDLDLILNNLDSTAFILENRAEQRDGAWFQVMLDGNDWNRSAIGARVTVVDKLGSQMAEVMPTHGYLSSSELLLHFGLGSASRVDSVIIEWPDGTWSVETDLEVNQRHTISYSSSTLLPNPTPRESALLSEQDRGTPLKKTEDARLPHGHRENSFLDFYRQRLIPRRFSINGPGMAVGDVDGDGHDDLWIGGASEYSGQIFRQNREGTFHADSTGLAPDAMMEDLGGLLVDVDNDGDLDLVVASGGNENGNYPERYRTRLYRNDGSGRFTADTVGISIKGDPTQAIAAADIDDDGDLDLFVGGRLVYEKYPESPASYLLRNDGGTFVEVTDADAPGLQRVGMVSSALFTDYDGDGDPDLLVVGEWMTPRLFHNEKGGFSEVTAKAGLAGEEGWWNSVEGGDFDGDGDIDYILGNLGLNSKPEIQADYDEPFSLYLGDFDQNGSTEAITSYYYDGIEYPSRTKADVEMQMKTYINRRFPSPSRYARAPLKSMYDSTLLANALTVRARTFASKIAVNQGDGTFLLSDLPVEAQFAPIHGIVVADFNLDGNLDVLLSDNFFGPDGSVVHYDAGLGLLMLGDGKGGLKPTTPIESGFRLGGDARSLVLIRTDDTRGASVVATCNQATTEVYEIAGNPLVVGLDRLDPDRRITSAVVTFSDGRSRREEFYYGGGYLSSSSRALILPRVAEGIYIQLYAGNETVWEGDVSEIPGLR